MIAGKRSGRPSITFSVWPRSMALDIKYNCTYIYLMYMYNVLFGSHFILVIQLSNTIISIKLSKILWIYQQHQQTTKNHIHILYFPLILNSLFYSLLHRSSLPRISISYESNTVFQLHFFNLVVVDRSYVRL